MFSVKSKPQLKQKWCAQLPDHVIALAWSPALARKVTR